MTRSCVSGSVRSIYFWFALFLGHNPLGSQPEASTLSLVGPELQLLFSYLYGTAKIMAQIFHLWTAAFSKIIYFILWWNLPWPFSLKYPHRIIIDSVLFLDMQKSSHIPFTWFSLMLTSYITLSICQNLGSNICTLVLIKL